MKQMLIFFLILVSVFIFPQSLDVHGINAYFDTLGIEYDMLYANNGYIFHLNERVESYDVLPQLSELITFFRWYIGMKDISPDELYNSYFKFVINDRETIVPPEEMISLLYSDLGRSEQLLIQQYQKNFRPLF